jgi:hypothetical protein
MKPGRKSWDDPTMFLAAAAAGSVMKSRAKVHKDTILRTQVWILLLLCLKFGTLCLLVCFLA